MRWEERETQDAELLIVAYGTPSRISMTAVEQLRLDRGLGENAPWIIHYYPASGSVGLVEIIMREGAVAEEAFLRPSVLPVVTEEEAPEGDETAVVEQEIPLE